MAPVPFSGALHPKKKSELRDIALALRIGDQGTKEELQTRIKKHLDAHSALEDDPRFAGLYGRRKRSVQPPSIKPRFSNRVIGLEPLRETSPVAASFVMRPSSSVLSTPQHTPKQDIDFTTPSSLPPLPPSPAKSIIEHLPKPGQVRAAVERFNTQELLPHGTEFLEATRAFLSNSQNIWTVTALFEVLYILSAVIPWKFAQLSAAVYVPYPPAVIFQTSAFWLVLLHWALPTLIGPAFVGNLISFNPPSQTEPTQPIVFDPLTASIVRLAASIAYPYARLSNSVSGLDVLGYNIRVFNASVGLAFAFAEAIAGAPRLFARTLAHEHRLAIAPPDTRALAIAEEESAEID